MSRVLLCVMSLIVLASCGVKRPLIAPKDIPAYEERQKRRIERLENDTVAPAPAPAQGQ